MYVFVHFFAVDLFVFFSDGLDNPEQICFLDEFTSTLDRQNARSCAASLSKAIRNKFPFQRNAVRDNPFTKASPRKKQECLTPTFVLASPNTDIIPYLQPSLVISVSRNKPYQILRNPNPIENRQIIVKAYVCCRLPF